jgi:hypothetical protein
VTERVRAGMPLLEHRDAARARAAT